MTENGCLVIRSLPHARISQRVPLGECRPTLPACLAILVLVLVPLAVLISVDIVSVSGLTPAKRMNLVAKWICAAILVLTQIASHHGAPVGRMLVLTVSARGGRQINEKETVRLIMIRKTDSKNTGIVGKKRMRLIARTQNGKCMCTKRAAKNASVKISQPERNAL